MKFVEVKKLAMMGEEFRRRRVFRLRDTNFVDVRISCLRGTKFVDVKKFATMGQGFRESKVFQVRDTNFVDVGISALETRNSWM